MMRIHGLIKTIEYFHTAFSEIIMDGGNQTNLTFSNKEVIRLHKKISEPILRVEELCKKHRSTPADLPNPSYRAYQWLKFLSQKEWLLSHLLTLDDFYSITSHYLSKKVFNGSRLDIRISHFNYLFRSKQINRMVLLEIHEGFLCAPFAIKQKIVESALNKRNRKHTREIKDYAASPQYKRITSILQSPGQVNNRSFKGKHINLLDLYKEINEQYFHGKMIQPRLMWSARRSKRRLGYYDPQSNTITINRRFDSPETPPLLVEYILYHEMLHQSLGIREINGRRYAHTNAFKKAEKRFKGYEIAEKMIKQVNQ